VTSEWVDRAKRESGGAASIKFDPLVALQRRWNALKAECEIC
jgi:hypothetical protein